MASRRVRTTTTTTRIEVSSDRGVFMISVAAELAEMHPQTLRMYESRGLIEPKRSPKGTRLYSQKDVDRLRRIQEMTAELGMNLAGVERVFELEQQLELMSRKVAALQKRAGDLGAEVERLESLRRELRAEIVPYVRGGELVRHSDLRRWIRPQ
jgi:MerR family transcriptional regulator/heat shock protein HspR